MNENVYISLRGAKRMARPLQGLWYNASLSTEDLRAYWRFRRLFMDLKPHIDPEKDWVKFAKWMQDADFSYLQRAPDGHLTAVLSFKIDHRMHEGRPVTLLWPEYGYSLPKTRKSAGLALSILFAMSLCLLRHPDAPVYFVGTGYLSGFVAFSQLGEIGWLHDEPSMSPWEQSLWRTLAESTSGYDPVRKIVNMGTIPRNPRTSPPKNPQMMAAWERYIAHNPQWTEGYTCLCMWRLRLSWLSKSVDWFGAWSRRTMRK